jgi:predicted RNase H-like nuclease (RuvC/YqgF family)
MDDNIRKPDPYKTDRLINYTATAATAEEELHRLMEQSRQEYNENEQLQQLMEQSRQEYEEELNKKRNQYAFALSRLRLLTNTPSDDQKYIKHLIRCCEYTLKIGDTKKPPRMPKKFTTFLETLRRSNVFRDLVALYEENF